MTSLSRLGSAKRATAGVDTSIDNLKRKLHFRHFTLFSFVARTNAMKTEEAIDVFKFVGWALAHRIKLRMVGQAQITPLRLGFPASAKRFAETSNYFWDLRIRWR